MLVWLQRTLGSSIGKKLLMALSGLALFGFTIVHLLGNFSLYADETGEAFDAYAHQLDSLPVLPLAEVGLAALFLFHIVLALKVTLENRDARGKDAYKERATHGARTAGSRTMLYTGVVLLIFLVVHLVDFRLQKDAVDSLAVLVKERLYGTSGFLIYVIGMGALGLHLSHALRSALQTLGMNHPRYNQLLERLGIALAVLIALGFVSFPVFYYFKGAA